MKTLAEINQEYQEIIHSDVKEPDRSRRLDDLMTQLESQYKISMIHTENKVIIALYRKISSSRSL